MRARLENELGAIAFFGGGTGGHLFPGIAVGERARERFPECRVLFFRTDRSVEDLIFEAGDAELHRTQEYCVYVVTGYLSWIDRFYPY